MKVRNNSNAFGSGETLLILLMVGIMGIVGWRIWANQAEKSSRPPVSIATTQKHTTSASQVGVVKIVPFSSQQEQQAVMNSYHLNDFTEPTDEVAPNVHVFKRAPKGLVDTAKQYAQDQGLSNSSEYGLTINYLSKNGNFAHGGTNGALVWKRQGSKWIRIEDFGAQSATGCDVIRKYAIPNDIMPECTGLDDVVYHNLTQ